MPDFSVRRIYMDKKIFNAELRYYTVIRLAKKMLAGELKSFSISNVAKELGVSTSKSDVDIIYEIGLKLGV